MGHMQGAPEQAQSWRERVISIWCVGGAALSCAGGENDCLLASALTDLFSTAADYYYI